MNDTKVLVNSKPINVAVKGSSVKVITQQRGERGPIGPGGTASSFDFTQATPSAVWTIAHNRGAYPTVTLKSVGNVEMMGTITHLSLNVVQVNFNTPVAGTARLI